MSTYEEAGVNKEAGYQTVSKIKDMVARTHNSKVLNNLGSFGAFYELSGYKNPVLVSGTDGVGTKIKIAIDTQNFGSIGVDCFAMCANDILCHGAKPLFFLDYLACGKLEPQIAAEIISGMTKACEETSCALIGGETAEMPGMYKHGDYDVAGFCVGAVEKESIVDGSKIREGDVIIGLSSSGFHSNGYSLIRKVFSDFNELWEGKPISEYLLSPTRLYQNVVLELTKNHQILGMAHITGGGLIENVPRVLRNDLDAHIDKSKISVPKIMKELQIRGNIPEKEMWGTFNMGVGFVLFVSASEKETVLEDLQKMGEQAVVLGNVSRGRGDIILK